MLWLPIQATPYLKLCQATAFGDVPLNEAAYLKEVLYPEELIKLRQSIFSPDNSIELPEPFLNQQ
jgi:hypothetical protein